MTTRTICGPSCKCSNHTDTPRTDAAKSYWDGTERENCVSIAFARGLERELKAAKALCEAQYKSLQRLELEATPDYWKEKGFSYCERAEKAEAEVERLMSQLERSIDIADWFEKNDPHGRGYELNSEKLSLLKAEIST